MTDKKPKGSESCVSIDERLLPQYPVTQPNQCLEYSKDCFFCDTDKHRKLSIGNKYALAVFDDYPVTPGHVLVYPIAHKASWFDLTFEERSGVLLLIDTIKRHLDSEYKPDGYNIGINDGEVAGQTVDHCHVHLIPRYNGDVDVPLGGVRYVIPSKGNYREPGRIPISRCLAVEDTEKLTTKEFIKENAEVYWSYVLRDLETSLACDQDYEATYRFYLSNLDPREYHIKLESEADACRGIASIIFKRLQQIASPFFPVDVGSGADYDIRKDTWTLECELGLHGNSEARKQIIDRARKLIEELTI